MSDLRAPSGRARLLRTLGAALFAGTALLLGWTALGVLGSLGDPAFAHAAATLAPAMLAACLLYAGSHVVRIARLALIVGDARLGLRTLAAVHLFTSGVSLALPFKLGDLHRAAALSAAAGAGSRGVVILFVERFCDAAAILLLLGLAAGSAAWDAGAHGALLAGSLLFVVAATVAAVLLPDNLRRLGNYLMRRHRGEWTVSALRRIADERALVADARAMLRGRCVSLAGFTLLIWLLEAASLALLFAADPAGSGPLGALLSFLSQIAEGLTLPARLRPDALAATPAALVAYLAATQAPLALAGLAAGIALGRGRARALATARRTRVRRLHGYA